MKNIPITPLPSGVRLVAIDLDGTLLNSQKQIPPGADSVFAEARQAGLLVSVVTGRNATWPVEIGRVLGLSGPHASSGGAMVCGKGGRPVYHRIAFTREDARMIVSISQRWNLTLFFHSAYSVVTENGGWLLAQKPTYFFRETLRVYKNMLSELKFRPIKCTLFGDPPALVQARCDIQAAGRDFYFTSAGEGDMDITPPGTSKGSALRQISAVTGVAMEHMMVIGDSPNDLSMFDETDLTVAVANALPEVRQAARWVVPSNDEGGVLWAIKNLALSPHSILNQSPDC